MPEEHHFFRALQPQTSPGTVQTCSAAPFPPPQTRGQTGVPLTNERVIFLTGGLMGTL